MRATRLAVSGGVGGPAHSAGAGARLPRQTLRALADALKTQWKRYRKELRRCQKKFSEEAVHESRVQTRRLFSLLELLSGFLPVGRLQKMRAALKHHLDTFDELRDTQVQLLAVKPLREDFFAAQAFYRYLRQREKRLTRQTRKAIKRVRTRQLHRWVLACRAEIKAVRKQVLPEQANWRLFSTVSAAFVRTCGLKGKIDRRHTETIHRTRVAFKKFRYMVETLAPYLPLANEPLLTALHEYQTMMGEIQDAEVLLQTWDKFASQEELPVQPAQRLRAELERRRARLIRVYLSAADQLLVFWPARQASLDPVPTLPVPGVPLKAVTGLHANGQGGVKRRRNI